jgi:O-antigen/teichoic acid export membrane protein
MRPHSLSREFLWVIIGQGTAALGAVVGIRLLTHALPPDAYGELALGLTGVTLTQQTLFSPLSAAALRYFAPAREAGQLGSYFRSIWALARKAVLLLVGAAVAAVVLLFALDTGAWLWLTAGAVVFAALAGACSLLDAMQNAARHRAIVAWHDGVAPWARFLLAVAFVAALGARGDTAMAGFTGASALLLASQWWCYRRRLARLAGRHDPERLADTARWQRTLVDYGWPFVTWGLFSWAQLASDRWALQAFASTQAVGLYAVLLQVGYYPMTLLSGLLSQLMAPMLFSRAGDGRDPASFSAARRLNRRLFALMSAFTATGVAGAVLFHHPLFALLVAPEYQTMSGLLPAAVASGGLFACGQATALTLLSAGTSRRLLGPKVATGLLGIALNGAGAALWGVPGVVAAGAMTAAVYVAWVLFLAESVDSREPAASPSVALGFNE